MFVVSKEYGIILNFDNIIELYAKSDGTVVVAKQADGKLIVLQEYENTKEAKTAIEIISEQISLKNVVYMPSLNEVKRRIENDGMKKYHNVGGKKTKGHGGS